MQIISWFFHLPLQARQESLHHLFTQHTFTEYLLYTRYWNRYLRYKNEWTLIHGWSKGRTAATIYFRNCLSVPTKTFKMEIRNLKLFFTGQRLCDGTRISSVYLFKELYHFSRREKIQNSGDKWIKEYTLTGLFQQKHIFSWLAMYAALTS